MQQPAKRRQMLFPKTLNAATVTNKKSWTSVLGEGGAVPAPHPSGNIPKIEVDSLRGNPKPFAKKLAQSTRKLWYINSRQSNGEKLCKNRRFLRSGEEETFP